MRNGRKEDTADRFNCNANTNAISKGATSAAQGGARGVWGLFKMPRRGDGAQEPSSDAESSHSAKRIRKVSPLPTGPEERGNELATRTLQVSIPGPTEGLNATDLGAIELIASAVRRIDRLNPKNLGLQEGANIDLKEAVEDIGMAAEALLMRHRGSEPASTKGTIPFGSMAQENARLKEESKKLSEEIQAMRRANNRNMRCSNNTGNTVQNRTTAARKETINVDCRSLTQEQVAEVIRLIAIFSNTSPSADETYEQQREKAEHRQRGRRNVPTITGIKVVKKDEIAELQKAKNMLSKKPSSYAEATSRSKQEEAIGGKGNTIHPNSVIIDTENTSAYSAMEWQTVGRRKGSKRRMPPNEEKIRAQGGKSRPKHRPPRTAAVVVKCDPEGTSYTEAMKIVKGKISLKELGIEKPNARKAKMGGLVIEIPNKDGGKKKAIELAAKMTSVLPRDVKVTIPSKRATVRIAGLNETSEAQEMIDAIAEEAGCRKEDIRIRGNISWRNGTGVVLVNMPLEEAIKIDEKGRILVSWTTVRVRMLKIRPLQCYKCLEYVHAKAECQSAVDNSKLCYRCEKEGHRAVQCVETPKCPICPPESSHHRMGTNKCAAVPKEARPQPPKVKGSEAKA